MLAVGAFRYSSLR